MLGLDNAAGGEYLSGTNFVPPSGLTLAFAILCDVTIDQAAIQFILNDQAVDGTGQHIAVRVNGTGSGAASNKLDVTVYNQVGGIHHFIPASTISSGLQLLAGVLDANNYVSMRQYYNKASEAVNSDLGSDTSGWNLNTNPLRIGRRGTGNQAFLGKIYWIALWNADPGDAAFDAMAGKTTPGVYKCANQYSPANLMYFFDCQDAGATFVEQRSGETFTKAGTIVTTTAPASIGKYYCKRTTADTFLLGTAAGEDQDQGGGLTVVVGRANAAEGRRRALLRFPNAITAGMGASDTLDAANLLLYKTARSGTNNPAGKIALGTNTTWTEGTSSTDGATYTHSDAPGGTVWSPGGFNGAAAGKGGNFNDTYSDAFTMDNSDTTVNIWKTYPNPVSAGGILTQNAGAAELVMHLTSEGTGLGTDTESFASKDSGTATQAPLLLMSSAGVDESSTGGGSTFTTGLSGRRGPSNGNQPGTRRARSLSTQRAVA